MEICSIGFLNLKKSFSKFHLCFSVLNYPKFFFIEIYVALYISQNFGIIHVSQCHVLLQFFFFSYMQRAEVSKHTLPGRFLYSSELTQTWMAAAGHGWSGLPGQFLPGRLL
jgi:hypothetical protein